MDNQTVTQFDVYMTSHLAPDQTTILVSPNVMHQGQTMQQGAEFTPLLLWDTVSLELRSRFQVSDRDYDLMTDQLTTVGGTLVRLTCSMDDLKAAGLH